MTHATRPLSTRRGLARLSVGALIAVVLSSMSGSISPNGTGVWLAVARAQDSHGGHTDHGPGSTHSGSSGHSSGGGADTSGHTSSDHSGGGHSSGGHSSGGHSSGSDSHESGATSRGKGPQFRGGEWAKHGTGKRHRGHASGSHGKRGRHDSAHSSGADRTFGGGSGLAGLAAVPEGVGRAPGFGQGPKAGPGPIQARHGPQYRHQLRYWGGWTIPEGLSADFDVAVIDDASSEFNPGSGSGSGTSDLSLSALRCEDVDAMSPLERVTGRNAKRLAAAVEVINPTLSGHPRSGYYMLANAQEELQEPNPDLELVASYFAFSATRALGLEQIEQVAFELCVDVAQDLAVRLTRAAESQRLAIAGTW